MKKIYLLLIISACFLFTGCTVKYDLTIDGSYINEEITITETSSTKLNTRYSSLGNITLKESLKYRSKDVFPAFTYTTYDFEENEKIEGESYYNSTWIEEKNNVGFKLDYIFDPTNFKDASSLPKCYDFAKVLLSSGYLTISTSQKFKCFSSYDLLDSVNIIIKTDNVVTSNNADSVLNNTYTWKITKANASNKPISIRINTNTKKTEPTEPVDPIEPVEPVNTKPQVQIWHIIIIAILIFGLLILAIVPKILSSRSRK